MHGKGVVRTGKRINLVISNDDMHEIIRIIKSLENSVVSIETVLTVKHENKEQKSGNFRCFTVRKYVNWERCSESKKRT